MVDGVVEMGMVWCGVGGWLLGGRWDCMRVWDGEWGEIMGPAAMEGFCRERDTVIEL